MIFLILASILWSFSFGLIKGMMPHIDPFVVSFLRLVFSCFLGAAFFRSGAVKPNEGKRFFLIGFVQLGLMYAPYMASFKFLKAHEVALFTMTTPIYIVCLASIINRQFNLRILCAAFIAVLGGSIVAWKNLESHDLMLGILLVQISNILFALGQWMLIDFKFESKTQLYSFLPFYFIGAAVGSFICLVLSGHAPDVIELNLTLKDWLVLGWLGIVSSGVGFLLWNIGAMRVSFGQLAVALDFKLPIAIVVSLVVFGESANIPQLCLGASALAFATWLVRPLKKTDV